jgi:predicted O-linked N-acetylglucosamine transferase (SPINDLY family)
LGQKLRLGYFSADLHEHPVGQLIVGLLEAHDRSQFEIYAFSFGGTPDGPTRRRIAAACDRFIDGLGMQDADIACLARENGVHIAVDLNGYTALSRPGIFAAGAAPIQVNYLGYPATMGSPCHHYIIGDRFVTPAEHYDGFSERVVTMPHTYLVTNNIKGHVPSRLSARSELGIPESAFIFCCFNATFKITPDAFASWMRILAAVEDSILWLSDPGPAGKRNLRREAKAQGIAPDRLVFAPRTVGLDYLARYRVADLFLDTFYYNAHATASEALMVGLPVVTRLGCAFAGRVAASLLSAIGMPELIAADTPGYERIALDLARDPVALKATREKLLGNASSHPLFDTKRYARDLEAAFREMWTRHEQGLAPDHITVR